MFTYKFSEASTQTPQFELDGVPLRLTATPRFLCINYCGKSYRDIECMLDIRVNSKTYIFIYSFCTMNPWFELPLETDKINYAVSIDLVRGGSTDGKEHSVRTTHGANGAGGMGNTASGDIATGSILSHPCPTNLNDEDFPGLKNLGATCYINSLLQSIYHLRGFKEHIFESSGYHSLLLQRLFYRLDRSRIAGSPPEDSSVYDAVVGFIKNLSFVDSVNTHQDVHEFSKMLFDRLENENKGLKRLIEGSLVNIVECKCGCVSTKDDPFQDIQLALNDRNSRICDVGRSLEVFCREEELHGYRCEKHGPTDARKRVMFKRLPDVLFVLVNRFSVDWENDEFIKNNDYYRFPERIDLEQYIYKGGPQDSGADENNNIGGSTGIASNKYKLYSIIVHSGGADEGHFYCYLKMDGKYYKFNDSSVYQCSKEEAVDWNFGGRYAHCSSLKNFSAYYLIYLREQEDGLCDTKDIQNAADVVGVVSSRTVAANNGADTASADVGSDPLLDRLSSREDVTQPRGTVYYKYFTGASLLGYSGLGKFNTDNYAYPITKPLSDTCLQFDNVSKIFRNRTVYNSEMEVISDQPVSPDELYFISDQKRKGRLVFVKVFRDIPWCTYPLNLYALGAFPIADLKDFDGFVDYGSPLLFKEQNGGVAPLEDVSDLAPGDAVIISRTDIRGFVSDYLGHELIHIYVDGNPLSSIFVKRGLPAEQIEAAVQEFVSSDEIFIVNRNTDDASCGRSSFVDSSNNIECLINSGSIFYVGIQAGTDINHITHVHLFLLPASATRDMLLRRFRQSKFPCMGSLQSESELEVVESFKESMNVRILGDSDAMVPNNSFIIIQKRLRNPIKVSFYTNSYRLINYPFFIENPGSVRAMREKYFFSNKIVRFDGLNYFECSVADSLSLKSHEILLIEQK